MSLQSLLLVVDTVLHVLGDDMAPVLQGLVITTGNEVPVAAETVVSRPCFFADDLQQQEPIVF